jgi:DNA-binding CsgD family transcriptional regulator
MNSQFIEELLKLFFNNCSNNPQAFVSNFDHSNCIIGYNYRCFENRFTHVSASFKLILGYNNQNILHNGNFTSKIVHPQDKDVIMECLRRSFQSHTSSIQSTGINQFTKVKCRARHIRGYWKYFIVYALDYRNSTSNSNDKIGVIVDERIRSTQEKETKSTDIQADMIPNRNFPNMTSQESSSDGRSLSPRENEVLEMISNGFLSKEIAGKLNISDSTVVTHRKNLISKLNVRNTAELIKKAARQMLI